MIIFDNIESLYGSIQTRCTKLLIYIIFLLRICFAMDHLILREDWGDGVTLKSFVNKISLLLRDQACDPLESLFPLDPKVQALPSCGR